MSQKYAFRKRVLIATDNFLPRWDGIARFLNEVVPSLSRDFDISILAPDFGEHPKFAGSKVKIIKFPLLNVDFADYRISLPKIKIIKTAVKNADVVFCNDLGPICFFAVNYAKKYNRSVVSYVHSLEWDLVSKALGFKGNYRKASVAFIKFLARKMYNKCTLLLVPSLEIARILENNRIFTDKIIVHMGIDTKKFVPAKKKSAAKKKLGINPKSFVFGYVGRLAREKDPITLIRAFSMLKNKNSVLIVAGSGLKSIEEKLKNKSRILWLGSINNIVPVLQAMDAYVLPSLTETSSLSTMEAMSCRVAPIVTKVGYLKNYIKDRENGLFFEMKNPIDLCSKMKLIMENEDLRKKISKNARNTVVRNYSIERTIQELKRILYDFV
ncbi:MAG: glycosyltransferase family 4 protein [Candidatus Woesearchaeota archaeon]